jgi:predicted dehydrogenase
MKKEKLRVGVIGTGRFGRVHLQVLTQLKNCEVTAIADIDEKLVEDVGRRWNISRTYVDGKQLITDPCVDVVDVVSDEASHAFYILEALRAGKHVFVEKPLATSFKDAELIYQEARKRQLVVMVGNISRFSQPYVTMKRFLDRGKLGKLRLIRAKRDFSRAWFEYFGKRVHTVYESGIHDIDLILWYAGSRCISVRAEERRTGNYIYPDVFVSVFTFENGVIAVLTSAWLVPKYGPQNLVETIELDGTIDADIELVGLGGCARFRMVDSGLSVWTDEGVYHPELTLWPSEHDRVGGAIRAELEHFLCQASLSCESPVAPLWDSVYALKLADAIVESARTGKTIKIE